MSPSTSTSAASDERRLVAAAQAGDQHAYAELLERHQAVAFRAACLITGSAAEAEDATQEACMKAWLALSRFRPGAPFRPWLVRIAINEARNTRRAAGRRATLVLRLDPGAAADSAVSAPAFASASASASASAEAETMARAERARLASAVGRLAEDDQLVIASRYFLGLSEAETATVLGLRRGTVKSRLSRSLGRLQTELERTE